MTMTLVSTVTVGSGGAASIDFTSIPQTGTDLLVVVSGRFATSSGDANIKFNGDGTSGNYSSIALYGSGSSTQSFPLNNFIGSFDPTSWTANTFSSISTYIPNYAGSTAKCYSSDSVDENNASAASQFFTAGKWSGTAAITSLSVYPSAGTLAQYSTASLYTITKGSGGATVS